MSAAPVWPTTPAPVAEHCGEPLAFVWQDAEGRRWLLHAYGKPVLVEGRELADGAQREELGTPPGARDALARTPKSCGCTTHEGDHDLHLDLMDREANARLLWPASDSPGLLPFTAYAIAENLRLRRLRDTLSRLELDHLPWAAR